MDEDTPAKAFAAMDMLGNQGSHQIHYHVCKYFETTLGEDLEIYYTLLKDLRLAVELARGRLLTYEFVFERVKVVETMQITGQILIAIGKIREAGEIFGAEYIRWRLQEINMLLGRIMEMLPDLEVYVSPNVWDFE